MLPTLILLLFTPSLALSQATYQNVPINPASGGVQLCPSQPEATQLINRFISILTHTTSDLGDQRQTAESLLSEDFQEFSNSIRSLKGENVSDGSSIAAKSKAEYIEGVTNAPPVRGVETQKIIVGSGEECDQILWYWKFNSIGTAQYPVKGFNLFTVARTRNEGMWQVKKLELEFDSVSWGRDTGFTIQGRPGQ